MINQDSIRYTLAGNMGDTGYVMQRNSFLLRNNRCIGNTRTNQYYLGFVKNTNPYAITLYKQEETTLTEGLIIDVFNATISGNQNWNTYYKHLL